MKQKEKHTEKDLLCNIQNNSTFVIPVQNKTL